MSETDDATPLSPALGILLLLSGLACITCMIFPGRKFVRQPRRHQRMAYSHNRGAADRTHPGWLSWVFPHLLEPQPSAAQQQSRNEALPPPRSPPLKQEAADRGAWLTDAELFEYSTGKRAQWRSPWLPLSATALSKLPPNTSVVMTA